jgi:hypothetical protein
MLADLSQSALLKLIVGPAGAAANPGLDAAAGNLL